MSMRHFTEAELLDAVRRRLGFLEQDCGCVVTRHDATDMNRVLAERLRTWYAEMLRGAPAALLPVADVRERAIPLGEGRWLLPSGVERVVSVRGQGWEAAVNSLTPAGARADADCAFPGLEPVAAMPLVVRSGRMIELRPAADLAELLAIAPPEEGYEFDDGLFDFLDLNKLWQE